MRLQLLLMWKGDDLLTGYLVVLSCRCLYYVETGCFHYFWLLMVGRTQTDEERFRVCSFNYATSYTPAAAAAASLTSYLESNWGPYKKETYFHFKNAYAINKKIDCYLHFAHPGSFIFYYYYMNDNAKMCYPYGVPVHLMVRNDDDELEIIMTRSSRIYIFTSFLMQI